MPHLGTDYAAPHGTQIHSVADGVVVGVGYTGNNGNFVKIKHTNTYETQYLHMSRFAKGIKEALKCHKVKPSGMLVPQVWQQVLMFVSVSGKMVFR